MSAILSADDLNDFISPGVACIKPVETLPTKAENQESIYEVTTEDKLATKNPPPAQISLTDCLACSGCVTSAEAVLISLQSHAEVLNTLDSYPELQLADLQDGGSSKPAEDGRIFVASVSPQVRASLAATYGISERNAGYMIEQFLSGTHGLRAGGNYHSGFAWVVDTNVMRDVVLDLTAQEVAEVRAGSSISPTSESSDFPIPRTPVLSSACPGWICYAEKTHPHVLPHLSRLKSPQALTGTFIKTVLSKKLNIHPSKIWHLAIMPCFDKKLEASRQELTHSSWETNTSPSLSSSLNQPTRDVDCVITSRELLMLASSRNITLQNLALTPLQTSLTPPFPDPRIAQFLFPKRHISKQSMSSGPSGGYLFHLLTSHQSNHPNSTIQIQRGRNADVVDYTLVSAETGKPIIKAARYYGFRNIQNLVRKLKPARASRLPGGRSSAVRRPASSSSTPTSGAASDYAYIEVMACPGGCTNGGGQIRIEDARQVTATNTNGDANDFTQTEQQKATPQEQRDWLARVDEAYCSADSKSHLDPGSDEMDIDEPSKYDSPSFDVDYILRYWSELTEIPLSKLVYTTFREVESDVGKSQSSNTALVAAEIAGKIGGGW